LLLLIFVGQELDEAVESMIHIWYSALIKTSHMDILYGRIRPLIEAVCTKIASKAPDATLGKTWIFGSRTLRVVLRKKEWISLRSYVELPDSLSTSRAQEIRTAYTMATERKDYRERRMLAQLPAHRLCANRFREDGILLPFGHTREQYTTPNPLVLKQSCHIFFG
jgi:hypothetical protein